MKVPLVSIVMNCFNGERFLKEALTSVINQTFKDWEIIFWDNQSTDQSAEIVKSYNEIRIKYFLAIEKNKLGQARNLAIEKCSGCYICFLDVDDFWDSDKLNQQINWFNRNPTFGFLYSNYNLVFEKSIKRRILSKNQPQGMVFSKFLENYPVNLQTVMIKNECIKKLNYLFDSNLELAEEYDFFLRILLTTNAGYIYEPLAYYRIHSNMTSIVEIEKWPIEMEYILDKYKREVILFNLIYSKSIKQFKAKISYYSARVEILKGNYAIGRRFLFPFVFVNYKITLLYLVSYLGQKTWIFLHKISSKII